jgi:hypothetical protein
MAEAAQRVLMNEFKALSKETWTNIEVRCLKPSVTFVEWRSPRSSN